MRARALLPAVLASTALHAGLAALWSSVAPVPSLDPAMPFRTQIEAVLIDEAQDQGDTPLPSVAAPDSPALSNQIDLLKKENDQLKTLTESLQTRLVQNRNDLTQVQSENEELKAAVVALEQNHSDLESDRTQLQQQVATMAGSYEHLVEEKTALAQDNYRIAANLVLTKQEKDQLVEEKTAIQDDLTRARERHDQLKTENTSLLAAQADLKNQAASLQRNDSELRDEVVALNTTIVKLTTTRNSLAEENARTAQAAKSLAADLATERQGKDRLAKEKAAVDDRFIKSQEQRDQLVAKKVELTNANTSLQGQIATLRQNDNDDRRQRTVLKAAITQLTQSRDRLIDENIELVTRLEISNKEATALRAQSEQTIQSVQPSVAALDTGNALRESDPRPVAGNPKPVYPRLAIRRGLEGEVSLAVSVSASGKVSEISISKPSGSKLLDQAALKAVRQWQFTPAIRDGTASPATTTIPVQFRLLNRVNS